MKYISVGNGRMGAAVAAQAAARGHERVAVVDTRHDGWTESVEDAEIAFEFTVPEAAADNVARLVECDLAVVSGTTGWRPDAALRRRVREAGAAVIHAPNFSVGVNAFFRIVARAARILGAVGGYDPAVMELHHRAKRDVPSGTARRLADTLAEALATGAAPVEGHPTAALEPGAIHVVGLRAGAEPGTHTVMFDGSDDRIELCHRARGRGGFATGAVLAAEWLDGRTGWYDFEETLDDLLALGGR